LFILKLLKNGFRLAQQKWISSSDSRKAAWESQIERALQNNIEVTYILSEILFTGFIAVILAIFLTSIGAGILIMTSVGLDSDWDNWIIGSMFFVLLVFLARLQSRANLIAAIRSRDAKGRTAEKSSRVN
jgi:hypothetical protein